MTTIKGAVNLDCLKTESPNNHISEKLVLAQSALGWKIKWMTPEKISSQTKSGNKLVKSLDIISKSIKNLNPSALNDDEVKIFNENIRFLQSQTEKHNKKIENSTFLRLVDKIICLFTSGKHTLKYDSLEPLCASLTQESSYRDYKRQLQAIPKSAEELLKLSNEDFLIYFDGVSFIEHLSIANFSQMSDSQKEIYFKLLKLKHKETVKHLIESPEFSKDFYEESQKNHAVRNDLAFAAWFNTYEKMINVKFIPQKLKYDLFRTAMFIEENRSLMAAGAIGSQSRTNADILKIKISPKNGGYKIPLEMDYNKKNGDIVICLGQLGKGNYKVVRNHLSLLQLQMKAVGKQAIQKVGDLDEARAHKETAMLQHCRGESNIIQLHDSKVYFSPKKGKKIIYTETTYYNMGDLLSCMKDLTDQQKLKVASDIIKGVIALHKKGIIHRDLKPENIFITKEIDENEKEIIKAVIGDPGLACWTKNDKDINWGWIGTPCWMSPQKLRQESSRVEDDYWAVGTILCQLFTGTFPGLDAKDISELKQIVNGLGDEKKNPAPFDKESVNYVAWRLMQPDLTKRMKLDQALAFVENI